MADKPKVVVAANPETAPATPQTIQDIKPGTLNSYSRQITHIPITQGKYQNLLQIASEVAVKASTPDKLDGMVGPFRAVVIRVEAPQPSFLEKIMPDYTPKLCTIKARIPELHISLPIPSGAEMNTEKQNADTSVAATSDSMSSVDFYPTFTAQNENVPAPKVGDFVWVTFENINQMQGGIYISPIKDGGVMTEEECAKKGTCTPEQLRQVQAAKMLDNMKKAIKGVKLSIAAKAIKAKGRQVYYPGVSTSMVFGIQYTLRKKFNIPCPATGSYDDVTASAVKTFQSQKGLTPDGMCGPQELELMFQAGMPVWFRIFEFLGDNETGAVRSFCGRPKISSWSGGMDYGNSNVVPTDGMGVNYGSYGANINTAVGKKFPEIMKLASRPYSTEKNQQIFDAVAAIPADTLMAIPESGSIITTLISGMGNASKAKAFFEKFKVELMRQRIIAMVYQKQIVDNPGVNWGQWVQGKNWPAYRTKANSPGSVIEESPIKNPLRSGLKVQKELNDWFSGPEGAKAQIKYVYDKYIGELLYTELHLREVEKEILPNEHQPYSRCKMLCVLLDVKAQYGNTTQLKNAGNMGGQIADLKTPVVQKKGAVQEAKACALQKIPVPTLPPSLQTIWGAYSATGNFEADAQSRHNAITQGSETSVSMVHGVNTYMVDYGLIEKYDPLLVNDLKPYDDALPYYDLSVLVHFYINRTTSNWKPTLDPAKKMINWRKEVNRPWVEKQISRRLEELKNEPGQLGNLIKIVLQPSGSWDPTTITKDKVKWGRFREIAGSAQRIWYRKYMEIFEELFT